jgi:hypothetical protein
MEYPPLCPTPNKTQSGTPSDVDLGTRIKRRLLQGPANLKTIAMDPKTPERVLQVVLERLRQLNYFEFRPDDLWGTVPDFRRKSRKAGLK